MAVKEQRSHHKKSHHHRSHQPKQASASTESHQSSSIESIFVEEPTLVLDREVASINVPANAKAIIAEQGPSTYSKEALIKDKLKPDPSTLVEIEKSLLSLFNMKRPPKIDRSKIIIPEPMKKLYAEIMGHELDSVNIPKPGLLTKSANTVRSFTHKGESPFQMFKTRTRKPEADIEKLCILKVLHLLIQPEYDSFWNVSQLKLMQWSQNKTDKMLLWATFEYIYISSNLFRYIFAFYKKNNFHFY